MSYKNETIHTPVILIPVYFLFVCSMRYFDRAALFADACQEFGFYLNHDEATVSLVESVYAEYARYLHGLGLKKAAVHFGDKAGKKGRQLLEGV